MNYLKRVGCFAIITISVHLIASTIAYFTGFSYDTIRIDILSALVFAFIVEILYESKK